VIQLGTVALPVPPLTLLAGVVAAMWLAEREARRLHLPAEAVSSLILISVGAGVIGARLSYVARYLSIYAADPLSVFSPSGGALVPDIGLLLAGIAALIYGQRRRLPLRLTLDALAPGLAIMGVALGVAHLASGDAFGQPARVPWSILLWGALRHPSQVYEIVGALAVFAVWWSARRRLPAAGYGCLLVVALSAALRVFLEAFRGDSQLMAGGLRTAQVWGLLVLGLCLLAAYMWGRGALEEELLPATPAHAGEERAI
jgi:phosphatidylglycerol:prolipoprotein diacylglycerol transferase